MEITNMLMAANQTLSTEQEGETSSASAKKAKKAGEGEAETEFSAAMAMLAGSQKPEAKPEGKQMKDIVQLSSMSKAAEQQMSASKSTTESQLEPIFDRAAEQAKSQGKVHNLVSKTAERVPSTQQSAASLNTAAAITGLEPWSKDWVFTGTEQEDPELKTLLGDAQKERMAAKDSSNAKRGGAAATPERIRELLAEMQGMRGTQAKVEAGESRSQARTEAGAQGVAATDRELMDRLNQLNGQIDQVEGAMGRSALNRSESDPRTGAQPAKTQTHSAMSGADFVSMLNGAKHSRNPQGEGAGQFGSEQRSLNRELRLVKGDDGDLTSKGFARDLDEITGSSVGLHAAQQHQQASSDRIQPMPAQLTGNVVKGSMAKDRLSSESLLGVSNQIRGMSTRGGGEVRVRLNPDNLGELHLKVVTHGGSVGLQIQASDESAKKVIEESLGHLRESLASQNLTLGKVELAVAGGSQSGGTNDQQRSDQASQQHLGQFDGMMHGNQGQSGHESAHGSRDREDWYGAPRLSAVPKSGLAAMGGMSGSSRNVKADGRLDVMA